MSDPGSKAARLADAKRAARDAYCALAKTRRKWSKARRAWDKAERELLEVCRTWVWNRQRGTWAGADRASAEARRGWSEAYLELNEARRVSTEADRKVRTIEAEP